MFRRISQSLSSMRITDGRIQKWTRRPLIDGFLFAVKNGCFVCFQFGLQLLELVPGRFNAMGVLGTDVDHQLLERFLPVHG